MLWHNTTKCRCCSVPAPWIPMPTQRRVHNGITRTQTSLSVCLSVFLSLSLSRSRFRSLARSLSPALTHLPRRKQRRQPSIFHHAQTSSSCAKFRGRAQGCNIGEGGKTHAVGGSCNDINQAPCEHNGYRREAGHSYATAEGNRHSTPATASVLGVLYDGPPRTEALSLK